MYCSRCGAEYTGQYCPKCGASADGGRAGGSGGKSWLAALLLCIFLGALGIHRFYVGKIGTGILWLLTGGVFGIGWLVDLILIAVGSFRDANQNMLVK